METLKIISEDNNSKNNNKKKINKRPVSHYTLLKNWLSSSIDKEIPTELLHYSSPINNKVLISLFLNIGKVNHFLDETMNNMYLYNIDKKELLFFVKKLFKDCKLNTKQLYFQKWDSVSSDVKTLKLKFPYLKTSDCLYLLEKLLQDKDNQLLETLKIKTPTIRKMKVNKNKKEQTQQINKNKSLSVKDIISNNFQIQEL